MNLTGFEPIRPMIPYLVSMKYIMNKGVIIQNLGTYSKILYNEPGGNRTH